MPFSISRRRPLMVIEPSGNPSFAATANLKGLSIRISPAAITSHDTNDASDADITDAICASSVTDAVFTLLTMHVKAYLCW